MQYQNLMIKGISSWAQSTLNLSSSHCFLHSTSAEAVAMGLLKQFEGMQLPAASELEWLVPEHDAPQKVGFEALSLPQCCSQTLRAFLILFSFVTCSQSIMILCLSLLTETIHYKCVE